MLDLKDIVVHYGGVQALKGISLSVAEGSITSLIGANGAGKSTTLKAISGLVPLTSGEIKFDGQRIDGLEPEEIVELGIGHVPEGKRLFLEMSVQDNLLAGAYLRRDPDRIEEDLERIYGYFPVLRQASRRPASSLSGGEQQMVAIGRGLMSRPRLLLLDEPSLGLSPLLTQEVGSIIKKIAEEGVSILLIEQNASLALHLAKKAYVMETGTIALEGPAAGLQNDDHVKEAYLGLSPAEEAPLAPAAAQAPPLAPPPQRWQDQGPQERWQDAGPQERWPDRMPPQPLPERRGLERPPAAEPAEDRWAGATPPLGWAANWERVNQGTLERPRLEPEPLSRRPEERWRRPLDREAPERWAPVRISGPKPGPSRVVKKSFIPPIRRGS